MKVNSRQFVAMVHRAGIPLLWLAMEIGLTLGELRRMLRGGEPFDYDQSKRILEMFGAEAMIPVIDWEAINVRCPL